MINPMDQNEIIRAVDGVAARLSRGSRVRDSGLLVGGGLAVLRDGDGEIKQIEEFANLITQVGDQMYMERGANIGTPPAAPTGMKLGTGGATAAAKTGAGAAIVTYITGSNEAFDSAAASSLNGSARRITYVAVWDAGTATNSAINEWAISNAAGPPDAAGSAADTIARAVTGSALDKTASDTLTITWTHDFEGT